MCVQLQGNKKAGEDCNREMYGDDCERDAFCFAGTSAKLGAGVCLQMCDGGERYSCVYSDIPNATCIPHNDGVLPVCHPMCHPPYHSCDEPELCIANCDFPMVCAQYRQEEHGYLCTGVDTESDGGKDGDECWEPESCGAGLQCVPGETSEGCETERCCTPVCNVTGDSSECAAENETCLAVFAPDNLPHPMYEDLGACVLSR